MLMQIELYVANSMRQIQPNNSTGCMSSLCNFTDVKKLAGIILNPAKNYQCELCFVLINCSQNIIDDGYFDAGV